VSALLRKHFLVSGQNQGQAADRKEIARLRDRIEELEELLGMELPWPRPNLSLTPQEEKVLALLLRAEGRLVTRDFAFAAIYGGRPECDEPDYGAKLIDVWIFKLRVKIKNALPLAGVKIRVEWGRGYYITKPDREKIVAFLSEPSVSEAR
jgi:DNA-binding response OmpR family regulator